MRGSQPEKHLESRRCWRWMSDVWTGLTPECIYYCKNGTSSVYFEVKYMDDRVIHRPFQHEDDMKTSGRTDRDFKH